MFASRCKNFIQSLKSKIHLESIFCVVAAYTVDVLEGIAGGTMVVQVTADDADVGVNDDLTFSIVSGDPASEFEIQNGNLLSVFIMQIKIKMSQF